MEWADYLVLVKGILSASAYQYILDKSVLQNLLEQLGYNCCFNQHHWTPVHKGSSIKTWRRTLTKFWTHCNRHLLDDKTQLEKIWKQFNCLFISFRGKNTRTLLFTDWIKMLTICRHVFVTFWPFAIKINLHWRNIKPFIQCSDLLTH